MLPYFAQPHLSLGPLTIHAFGVLVGLAVTIGVRILRARAARSGLPDPEVLRFVNWLLLGGFVGAHLADRFVYFPRETLADPMSILRFWQGLSSFGGFVGGTLGAVWFFRRHAAPGTAWRYLDSFAFGFPFGWIFGRLGCFVAFDHPGLPTRFVLGQVYTDGIVRHNLGLYEALYTMVIAGIVLRLDRRKRATGFYMAVLLLLYSPFRFAMDFLRIVDVRYLGLTPGQYGSVALLLVGAVLVARPPAPGTAAAPVG